MKPLVLTLLLLGSISWSELWSTPDQQGYRLFQQEEFVESAETFRNTQWQANAYYRGKEFKKAAELFARSNSAESLFNQGNARIMLGEYEKAIDCYNRSLKQRPDWQAAIENKELAVARAAMLDVDAGDSTGGQLGADDVVFDNQAKTSEQTEEVAGSKPLTDQEIQATWLRRVSTSPADFLKAKFAYQQSQQGVEE